MPVDLYGESYMSYRDVARKLVTLGVSKPFYQMHIDADNNISYSIVGNNQKVSLNHPGIYVIYRKLDNRLEALYSGHSNNSISHRIYRFIKELQDRSRDDEDHYAAKKARHHGVTSNDTFMIKVLHRNEIPTFDNFRYDMNRVDECIATLLKTRFNERLIYD
jgi:hypothetical protein